VTTVPPSFRPRPSPSTAARAVAPARTGTPAHGGVPANAAFGDGEARPTLKIALVCDWFLPRLGGIELHLRDLAQRLTTEGHEVHVITSTPGDDRVAELPGVQIHRLRAPRLRKAEVVYTRGAIREIDHLLRRERFDVVHAHVSIVSPVAFGGAWSAQRASTPLVITYHSTIRGLPLLFGALNLIVRVSRWRALHTAVSGTVAKSVALLAGGGAVLRLPNAIETDAWRVEPFRSDPRDVRLISVMRLNAKKRPRALLRAFRRVVQRVGTEYDVRLRIVGDGPEMPALQRLVARLRLEEHVTLLGARTRAEIRELYRHADAFVLAATHESFGIAALEARCAGLPVVAMRDTGVADFVRDGSEGLLATSDRDLARCLESLVRDPVLRASIAAHNRETPPPLGWPGVIARHLRMYAEAGAVLSTRANRPGHTSRTSASSLHPSE
jgi:glycosyltransferase involved in cell wall biosynthesis